MSTSKLSMVAPVLSSQPPRAGTAPSPSETAETVTPSNVAVAPVPPSNTALAVVAALALVAAVVLGATLGWAVGDQRRKADDANGSLRVSTATMIALQNSSAFYQAQVQALSAQVATANAQVATLNASRRSSCPGAYDEGSPSADPTVTAMLDGMVKTATVFDPLSADEMRAVTARLLAEASLALEQDASAITVASNYISSLDFMPPPAGKAAVLAYIDGSGPFVGRYARATINFGARNPPEVAEFTVGPLGASTMTVTRIAQPVLPFAMRAPDYYEYSAIGSVLSDAMHELRDVLIASYDGYHMDSDCSPKCLTYTDTAPRGWTRNTRTTWFWFLASGDGAYVNNIGLEMLVDHWGTDSTQWRVVDIMYNSQNFSSVAALRAAFSGSVPGFRPASISSAGWTDAPDGSPAYSTLRRRGTTRPLEPRVPPTVVSPQGQRWAVRGQSVYWMGWQLHVGYTVLSGPVFRDLRFRGERIVYEMALQEAFAGYSDAFNPHQIVSQYLDSAWGMSKSSYELVEGVDCPYGSTFLNVTFTTAGTFAASGAPITLPRAVCIFEDAMSTSAMRHFDNDFKGGYNFMAATPLTRLVIRYAATVYNYDYTYETAFYPDGSIENRAIASGYLQSTYFDRTLGTPMAVGTRVQNYTLGSLHDHFWNYKIDMDILGTSNSLTRHEFATRQVQLNFTVFPRGPHVQKFVRHTPVATEAMGVSSMRYDPANPVVFAIGNPLRTNKWGSRRAYKIQFLQTAVQMLDDSASNIMPSAQWLKYSAVVTRRSDNITQDRVGYSMFDQAAMAEPVQRFDDWAFNGEPLSSQDLVAWVTVGTMHMPHAEDIPVTYSIGVTSSFMLKPMNYFDESPLMDLTSSVLVKSDGSFNEANVGVKAGAECYAPATPFAFRGGQVAA